MAAEEQAGRGEKHRRRRHVRVEANVRALMAATSVVVALIVTGLGWGLVGPGIAGYISRHTPPERQGRALGMLHGVGAAARIVGPPGFGLLASMGSFVPPFCVAAGVAAMAAAVAWWAPAIKR